MLVTEKAAAKVVCAPRWATRRRPDRPTRGAQVAAVAEALGTPLMPWQQLVADVGGEYDPESGIPCYREIAVTVPRQSGKTTLVLGFEVQRALGWGRPQRVVYTAQTGFDARKKLIDDQAPLLMASPLSKAVDRVLRAAGQEGIIFANGSRVDVMATSDSAGHGRTVDLGVLDEAFADTDGRREQAVLPAMATRKDAQLLIPSTAGTEESVYLRRKVELGRSAVDAEVDNGIAYFEWSAAEDIDIDDPSTWPGFMPALGHTIDESVVAHAKATMTPGEWERAFANRWTVADDRLIPAATWDIVNTPDASPTGELVFGVDVNPERSASAIVVASRTKPNIVEVIEHRPGTGWLEARAEELDKAWSNPTWAVDGSPSSPVSSVLPALARAVAKLEPVKGGDIAAACGNFYDGVVDRGVEVRRHPSLDAAVAGAHRRLIGDGWVWARRGAVDISPLMAATVALWVARTPGRSSPVFAY